MKVDLRPIEDKDLPLCKTWWEDIEGKQYLSRFQPRQTRADEETLAWYIIVADSKDIGTVWLEKDSPEDDSATLGIFIGLPQMMGKGIGSQAVEMVIQKAKGAMQLHSIQLRVRRSNTRAIACYQRCGFEMHSSGVKTVPRNAPIPYLLMQKIV